MQQAKLLLRLLLMQGSRDKSTLIVSAQICHYNLITNNRPLTFETAYQILVLKVDWRPALLPPEGNFYLGGRRGRVRAGQTLHVETQGNQNQRMAAQLPGPRGATTRDGAFSGYL